VRRNGYSISRLVLGYGVACAFAVLTLAARGHDPHDVMNSVVVGDDDQLFVVLGYERLLRSDDAGATWQTLANGLTNRRHFSQLAYLAGNLYLGTDGDGLFRSTNDGDSWESVAELGGPLRALFVESSEQTVHIGTAKRVLYSRSVDEPSWRESYTAAADISSVSTWSSDGIDGVLLGLSDGGIAFSLDAARTWQQGVLPESAGNATGVLPWKDYYLITTSGGGVFRWSVDDLAQFVPLGDGLNDLNVRDIAAVSATGPLVISTWHTGAFLSFDDGESWSPSTTGLSKSAQADSAVFRSPHFRDLVVQRLSEDQKREDTVLLGGYDGLFKSVAPFSQWRQLETEPVGRIHSMLVRGLDSDDFEIWLSTYGAGVYRGVMQGTDWTVLNRGLRRARTGRLYADAGIAGEAGGRVFLLEDEGNRLLSRSDSGVEDWTYADIEKPFFTELKVKVLRRLNSWGIPDSLTIDHITRKERVKMGHPKTLAFSPFERGQLVLGTRWRGLQRSKDGGRSLEPLGSGPDEVWSMIWLPTAGQGALIASARQHGIVRSLDAGKSWGSVSKGLDFIERWASDGQRDLSTSSYYTTRLAQVQDAPQKALLFGGPGIYRTQDAGDSWQRIGGDSFGDGAYVVAVAAGKVAEETIIFASVKGRGLWLSRDGGDRFQPIGQGFRSTNTHISNITLSPTFALDKTLFVASHDDLYQSIDMGESWQQWRRSVRYEAEKDYVVPRTGAFDLIRSSHFSSGEALSLAASEQGALTLEFDGTSIAVVGTAPQPFDYEMLVDGELRIAGQDWPIRVDQLTPGVHELQLTLKSGEGEVTVDAIDVGGYRAR